MSLRKSPTLTPARLAANRRNALISTGPRTACGKAWSRLNGLRSGTRSVLYQDLFLALLDAPPCAVERTARALLSPAEASHPCFPSSWIWLAKRKSRSFASCDGSPPCRCFPEKKDVKKTTSEARMSFRISGRLGDIRECC